jgi:SAM-dependent methyltransferase
MGIFHRVEAVPSNSCILLRSEQEAAAYPRGEIELGFCSACGFVSNVAFDPHLTEYSRRYEETQGFSGTFNAFHRALAERLIERFDLHRKDIIEIGCGKGEFLLLLCELGDNRGVGFDPGVHHGRIQGAAADRVQFVKDFYCEKYAAHKGDFVACKMTLEHIHPTGDFIAMVRGAIGGRTGTNVFFQVPEATRILRDCAFEDIYYEHCSYFSPGSLARLFRANGFEVLGLSTEYEGQYLTIEARAAEAPLSQQPLPEEGDIETLSELVSTFPERFEARRREWANLLENCARNGQKAVIWGAASKAVAFLSTLPGSELIRYGVDLNPYRQGHFLPGTALSVVEPDFLAHYRPDLVVIMNPIYRGEIARDLDRMGLKPEIVSL